MTPTAGSFLPSAPDRLLDLLADRAVQGLPQGDQAELELLLNSLPGFDVESLDRTAAALAVAYIGSGAEPVPESLDRKLRASGEAWAAGVQAAAEQRDEAGPASNPFASAARRTRFGAVTGWFAAAAALLLAVAGWWGRASAPAPVAQRLAMLRNSAADLVVLPWAAGPTAAEAGNPTGEIIWSHSRQEGYMVFRNMKANDPAVEQYQLWIFDATRDDRYPIDGGVFDVAESGEVIVPIRARMRVQEAALFAVTVESPGGVVVSDRKRLPVLAQVTPRG